MERTIETTFAYYGLDKNLNFLQAPVCECGCGQCMNMVIKEDDVYGLMHELLDEHDCGYCAIFTVKRNDTAIMGVKIDGDIRMYDCKIDGHKKELFKALQEDMEFHCYGLIEQVNEELYRIIMD